MKRSDRVRSACIWTVLLVAGAASGFAQGNQGAIRGTVTDPSGAVVANATLLVTSEATGVAVRLTTKSDGFYSAEALTPGAYTVEADVPGFKRQTLQHVQVDPGQTREASLVLAVGASSEVMNVEADALAVETQESGNAGTITSKQVDTLMLNGRNFQSMGQLIPGVSSTAGNNQQQGGGLTGSTTLIVNGQSVEYSVYTLDGVYNMNTGNLANINILPIVDSIDEFRILKDNYSARYGLAGSGQVVVQTKSGSRQFHGSAWDYLRNDATDAIPYFNTTTTKLRQNIFGYTFGGPIFVPHLFNTDRHQKLFFFASNEWRRNTIGSSLQATVFTQAQRAGTFSSPLTLTPTDITQLAARGAVNCQTGPNTISPACFDPSAVALVNAFMPLPNNNSGGGENYINTDPSTFGQDSYNYRVDDYVTDKEVVTGRFSYEQVRNGVPNNSFAGSNLASIPTTYYTTGLNMLLRLTSTLTPSIINSASIAETYDKPRITVANFTTPAGVNIAQAFPNANTLNKSPNIVPTGGYSSFGGGTPPIHASDGEGIISDDLSWTKGSHVLQFGALYIAGVKNQNVFTYPNGQFTFNGTRTGDPVADTLLGLDYSYHQDSGQRSGSFHYRQGEAYAQDDWHVSRKLTINAGLRWQYFSPNTNSGNQVTSFYASQYDPTQAPVVTVGGGFAVNGSGTPVNTAGTPANLFTGLVLAGQNGVPSGFFTASYKDFAPRVGFAYDLSGDGKTSIRGGYGIGYSRLAIEAIYNAFGQNPPFTQSSNILGGTLEMPTAGASSGASPQSLDAVGPNFVPAQLQSYSLSIDHQLFPNAVLGITYAGTQVRHADTFNYDQNEPVPVTAPSQASPQVNCLAPTQAPSASYNFDPCINGGFTSPNYTRPYQGYSSILTEAGIGNANYNGFQTGFQYRKSTVQATVAYTYSKSLSQLGHANGNGTSIGTGSVQDWRNLRAEYGPASFDRPHVLTMSAIYDIPVFRNSGNFLEKTFIGGWSLATLGVLESGFANTPGLSTATAGQAIRPDQVAPIHLLKNKNEWFDTAAFQAPLNGFYGDASTGSIRGPREISFNVATYKTIPIHERLNFEFRAEAFNFLNHPNFSGIDTSLGDAAYGKVTSALDPRILEFSGKVVF